MKRFSLLLLLVVTQAFAAVPPAEKLLPPDTLAVLTVPDWARSGATFSNAAFGRLLADPAMKPFRDRFVEKFNQDTLQPMEKELGLKMGDYLELARGQFTIAVTQNGWDGRSDKQPGFVWLVDTREKSSQLQTNLAELRRKWTDAGRKMRTEKIRDVEFTVVIVDSDEVGKSLQKLSPGPKPPADEDPAAKPASRKTEWVIGQSGSLLLVGDALKDVEKILALQAGGSLPTLADQAAFTAAARLQRDAEGFLWINTKTIMATLARRPEPKPAEGENGLGGMPSLEKVLNAIGLSGVQTIAANLTQAPQGSQFNVALNVPEGSRKGLFSILAVAPKDASPPPFVPADSLKFTRWRIDLQNAWQVIESAMTEISPQYAGFSKLILDTAGKDKDPNFDFRKQLLGNLGDDIITYEKAPRTPTVQDLQSPPALTLIGSKNASQLAGSLKAVTSILPPNLVKYNEREFLGRTIYSITLPNAGGKSRPLSYAASGGYVAFSSDVATLEEYLRSGEGNVKPLRAFPGLNEAAQQVAGTGNGYFTFENQLETTRAAFEAARNDPKGVASLFSGSQLGPLGAMNGGAAGGGLAAWFDFSLLPAFDRVAKYFHFNISAVGVTPEAITFKIFSPTPPNLKN